MCKHLTCQKSVNGCSESIEIRSCVGLSQVLLWRGIAPRTQGIGITCLPGFEVTGDAEVNQDNTPFRRTHNIGRFQVTKDNRGGPGGASTRGLYRVGERYRALLQVKGSLHTLPSTVPAW